MAIELKEIMLHIKKGVTYSIRIGYKSARAHPYISGFLFLLLILHRAFPSLFGFLISSSPVILCTAILLGTLLSYGTPNIPEIEEEDKKTQEISSEISSLQTRSVVDGVLKVDESCTRLTHLKTDTKTNESAEEEAVGEASNIASNEVKCDVPSGPMHDKDNHKSNTVLTTSLFLEENKQEIWGDMKEESELMDYGFIEDREISMGNQAELAPEDADVHNVAVNDQNEPEGLRIQIAKPASDSPLDSSLGSPWQPVNTCYLSSGSDSDGAESSSPDASMADIMPMLDELHPLLEPVHPQSTLKATYNSDAASSGLSQDSESESGSAEHEVENKENAESEEKDETDDVLVPWTTDDQKNVMDLGYIEAERNRRLENLIARRRLRKLQRFETQKNLIDIDSFYPSSIPPISAPRQNPFDVPHDFAGPGSAPSVMQPRQNPFDLPCDQVGEVGILSREYLSHHDFISAAQREMTSRRLESSTAGPSFLSDSNQEKKGPKLKSRFVGEGICSEEIGVTAFGTQVTSQKELIEPEINQETAKPSSISNDVELVQQDEKFFETAHSVDKKHEWSLTDVDTEHATDFSTFVNTEETDFGVMAEEIGVAEDNLPVSDTGKLEVLEVKYEDLDSSSSLEECQKISRLHIHEPSANPEKARDESIQPQLINNAQAADLCDLGVQETGKPQPYISAHDGALIYEGSKNFTSNPMPSDSKADLSEVASPPSPFGAGLPLEEVRSRGEDLTSGIEELLVGSSDLSFVDENESRLREMAKINEHDSLRVVTSETSEDAVHLYVDVMPVSEADGQMMHLPSLASGSSSEGHSVDVDNSSQFARNNMTNEPASVDQSAVLLSPKVGIEESPCRSFGLPSIFEETLEDFNPEAEHKKVMHPSPSSGLTASQVLEEANVHMSDIVQEPSISLKADEEIDNNDLVVRLDRDEKDSDVSGGSLIRTHDGDLPGSQFLELTGSMEFSTRLEMKSEHDVGFSSDLSDAQTKFTVEILSKKEGGFPIDLNISGKEAVDGGHAEVSGIKDIDENLLSEIEAVGDYRMEREQKSDQRGPDLQLEQFNCIVEGSGTEMQGLPNRLPIGEDPEMTVYNSKLQVLEACSIDELDSIFKQHGHEESVVLPASDLTLENSVTSQTEEGDGELGITNRDQELTGTDTELLLTDAKSVEDISSALKQPSVGLNEPSTYEVETLEVLPERTCLETEESKSDLHVIEAKSLDDIDFALKPPSEVTVRSPLEQLLEGGHAEVTLENSITSQTGKGDSELGIANRDQELTGTDAKLLVVEAKSVEDISSALKQLSECHNEPSISGAETTKALPEKTCLEPEETNSDLHVIEAKSLDDINLALKPLFKYGHTGVAAVQYSGPSACERQLEREKIEVHSAEEISLDSVEMASRQVNMVTERSSEEEHGSAAVDDVSSSSGPTSRKIQKKKSGNHGSDSSSSSSSSSSDSD